VTRLVLDASAGVELLLNTTRAHSLSAQFPASAEWFAEHIGATLVTADERLARSPGLAITTIVP